MWQDLVETDSFSHERYLRRQSIEPVAGTDEAGRGPLAGPVVAACVILPADLDWRQFKDSKKLTPKRRAILYEILQESAADIGLGFCSPAEIDRYNILQASLYAMKRAVRNLACQPEFLLVDGKFTVPINIDQLALVKGEDRSASIAAASIVAKEVRDHLMIEYAEKYPQYNFSQHKGYPTAQHRGLVAEYGPCPIHRRTFKGVKEFCRDDL